MFPVPAEVQTGVELWFEVSVGPVLRSPAVSSVRVELAEEAVVAVLLLLEDDGGQIQVH